MKNYTDALRPVFIGLACASLLSTAEANVEGNVIIGRYLTVNAKPHHSQQHLLQQQIQIKFPENILTVKQAMEFMLQFSGYRLAPFNQTGRDVKAMLEQPLPEIDRTFGPVSLQEGLVTLAGGAFYLLIDPVHRLVSFEIRPRYSGLYEKN